jgi:putative ABC transport system permease protein
LTGVPWRLIAAHLRRSWFRSLLTAGGVALAIFLLVVLRTVITELQAGVKHAARSRLITSSAVSLFANLPAKLETEIRSIPGVREVTHWTWFGGVYVDESNMFARFAVDVPSLRRVYGDLASKEELLLEPAEWVAFEEDRRGCIVGAALARTYGFRVGDRVNLLGNIWPGDYEFTVRGIYRRGSPQIDEASMFFQWKYLDESVGRRGEVSLFVASVEDGYDAGAITREIDLRFESSPHRTRTLTEAAFNQQFISMWGNVPVLLGMIGGAVLFSAVMIALNTSILSARDRRLETGVLKALGFRDRAVLLLFVAEGLCVCGGGGALGTLAAKVIFDWVGIDALYRFFPAFLILPETVAGALAASLGVGLVSGLVPGVVAARTRVIDALARFG